MTTITETLPTLVNVPTTADPDNFDAYADNLLGTQLPALITSFNTATGQYNTVAGEVNTNRVNAQAAEDGAEAEKLLAQGFAGDSEDAADASAASANFQGEWSLLSGALAMPASVAHNGAIWVLLNSLADVTASEPGVDADWALLNGTPYETRTANTILTTVDKGKIIDITSGTFSQTFTAAATLGETWYCYVRNNGSGVVTLDPDSTETINNATTLALRTTEMYMVICDGVSAFTAIKVSGDSGLTLLATATASNGATVDFTGLSSAFDEYVVELLNVVPDTDAASLSMRTSTNGGSSYDSGASDYRQAAGNASSIILAGSVGSDANETGVSVTVRVISPASVQYCQIHSTGGFVNSGGDLTASTISAQRSAAADVDAIRFFFSSGNIESGKFNLYGLRKA